MNTSPCVPCCTTPQSVQVPGSPGGDGQNGVDGTNAFTTTTADFLIPAIGDPVTVPVVNSLWMALEQVIVFEGPATFQVTALPSSTSVTCVFLGYALDLTGGATISAGAKVSPAGTQPFGMLSASAVLDFGSTNAQTSSDLTIAVPGAALGDPVILGVPNGATLTNSSFSAWVSAVDVVKVRFMNASAGSLNPASGSFTVIVIKL